MIIDTNERKLEEEHENGRNKTKKQRKTLERIENLT